MIEISAIQVSGVALAVSLASLLVAYRTYAFNTRPNLQLGSPNADLTVQAINLGPRPVLIQTMITTKLGEGSTTTYNRVDLIVKTNDALDLSFYGAPVQMLSVASVVLKCVHASSNRPFERHMVVAIMASGKISVLAQGNRRIRAASHPRLLRHMLTEHGYPAALIERALS